MSTALVLHTSPSSPSFEPPASHLITTSRYQRLESSYSAATVNTQVSQPSDPLLSAVDESSAYDDMPPTQPWHRDQAETGWDPPLSYGDGTTGLREKQNRWRRTGRRGRLRRWRAVERALLSAIAVWAMYTAVRYFIAFAIYSNSIRRTVTLAFGISSSVALCLVALSLRFSANPLLFHAIPNRSSCYAILYFLRSCISLFLITPAIVNLALVFAWRDSNEPQLRLTGRCHWDIDVGWVGVGGQCPDGHPWGIWLAAAVVRLCITLAVLIAHHAASHLYSAALHSLPQAAGLDPKSTADVSALHEEREATTSSLPHMSQSSIPATPLAATSPSGSLWERRLNSATPASRLPFAQAETLSATPRSDSRVAGSRHSEAEGSQAGSGIDLNDLRDFADRFRSLVGQVAQDIQAGMRLSPDSPPSPGAHPPLYRVLDTHQPYMSLDEFGRPVVLEENMVVLGRTVRRMPTIDSVSTRERADSIVHSQRSHTPATESTASFVSMSRSSTRRTTHSSRASHGPSRPSSGSNSMQSPPSRSGSLNASTASRMASELSEYVLAAVRRPNGSSPSFQTALTNGTSSGGTHSTLSRRNSINGVLAPVSEHEHAEGSRRSSACGVQLTELENQTSYRAVLRDERCMDSPVRELGEGSSGGSAQMSSDRPTSDSTHSLSLLSLRPKSSPARL